MSMAASLHISLSDPLKAYVDEQMQSGEYGTPSEYFSDLIRHDQELKQAALEKRLLAALEGEADALELTAEQVGGGNLFALLQDHANRTR